MDTGLVCYVCGPIGVGKSTLLRDAEKTAGQECAVATFVEYLNQPFFNDYVADPKAHAFSFQLAMMQSACTRVLAAESTVRALGGSPLHVIVERPAQENVVFAWANHRHGAMDIADTGRYLRYIGDMTSAQKERSPSVDSVAVYLWAPESTTIDRMIERGRLSEDAYVDSYLECLADSYFRAVMESLLLFEDQRMPVLPYIVVDWSEYGSWNDLAQRLARTKENGVYRAWFECQEHLTVHMDDAAAMKHLFEDAESGRIHPHTHDLINGERGNGSPRYTLELNLSMYHALDPKDFSRQRSMIRDHFFRAISQREDVHLHVEWPAGGLEPGAECGGFTIDSVDEDRVVLLGSIYGGQLSVPFRRK